MYFIAAPRSLSIPENRANPSLSSRCAMLPADLELNKHYRLANPNQYGFYVGQTDGLYKFAAYEFNSENNLSVFIALLTTATVRVLKAMKPTKLGYTADMYTIDPGDELLVKCRDKRKSVPVLAIGNETCLVDWDEEPTVFATSSLFFFNSMYDLNPSSSKKQKTS